VSTYDIARKKYSVDEVKKQAELHIQEKEKNAQDKGRQEYYKKRNNTKGRMLERKNGQPVMKHMIKDMLSKIKASK